MKISKIAPKKLKRNDWLQIWAGSWGLLSCSHFAVEYVQLIKFHGRPFVPESVIIVKNGKSQGWARQQDREGICNFLAAEISRNPKRVAQICKELKKQADSMRAFIKTNSSLELNSKTFQEYFDRLVAYYRPHINVKYVVDGLSPSQIKKFFGTFEDARVYAETVLAETEQFLLEMSKKIGKKSKLPATLVMCCTYQEIEEYLKGQSLPKKSVLEKRDKDFAVYASQKTMAYFVGGQVKNLEAILVDIKQSKELKGAIAQTGKVSGRVRIIIDPKKALNFRKGEILVASMTRPDFLPLMKKASAFVTDSGGLLSHAAIIAREMKKPCIIGTKIATKFFKDGDMVEVDANRGIVKILKK